MSLAQRIPIQLLGQSGCLFRFPEATVYLDPYLSNSVQELNAPDLAREVPIPFAPEAVKDANWVLITHEHIDHCDPHTLPKIAIASPQARFMAPPGPAANLRSWGIDPARIQIAREDWVPLAEGLRVRAVPAAHPEIERDSNGHLLCAGYLLDYHGKRIYLAGDTFARQEIIDCLAEHGPVHTAFLPVNEHNFFRDRRGILGNMSVREAFQFATEIAVKQVVAVHWDMFAINAVDPDEIRLIHKRMNPGFSLLLRPNALNLGDATISVVIRTLNEARHLDELLDAVARQETGGLPHEVVLVDSGSTDGTLEIAERHGCRILHITREDFSFGRSLNIGCDAAQGDVLVFTSGHCVPTDGYWLSRLCQPILEGHAGYSYGRQIGGERTYFSESRIFAKYFPERSAIPQGGFYCNNANAAVSRDVWARYRFDEELTGLEDMHLAKRMVSAGGKVAYIADAVVLHYHYETWQQVRRRFEREAIALQQIMPQVHVTPVDTLRYIASSMWKDWRHAMRTGQWHKHALDIARYRWHQYIGSYKGNHEHRKLSHAQKEKYFFPH
ncbi:MAG TPA: MBL fold metallo-hydrolase [Azoarcus taiwanensis]|nr:MBL fold metallo-hydrolase [Azoarcus taiwanensis]